MGLVLVLITITVTVTVAITITVVSHMFHGTAVAFFEALAERPTGSFFDWRMFEHLVVVGVGMTARLHVVASNFYTFMETTALCILAIIAGRHHPSGPDRDPGTAPKQAQVVLHGHELSVRLLMRHRVQAEKGQSI